MPGKEHHILVVGQTPPPFGGQSVMIEALLQGSYPGIRLHHVRLAFSEDMDSVGRFAVRKVFILIGTILRIWWARIRYGCSVLYYPPSGPNLVPVLRDLLLLGATRWLFRKVVFHFHAGGVSGFATQLPAMLRPIFRLAYRHPALAIRTAPQNPDDGAVFDADRCIVVPNGIPDKRGTVPEHTAGVGEPVTILFTGVLIQSKGVRVLLEAFQRLRAEGGNVRLQLMGRWGDAVFQQDCMQFIRANGLEQHVEFLGVRMGEEKLRYFAGCDVFCFPTFFESESFGLVLLEAMQFAKPVVSTAWRGIPSVVADGRSGYLVPVHDVRALTEQLAQLVHDPAMRRSMGDQGRSIFEQQFTLNAFHRSMANAFHGLFEPT